MSADQLRYPACCFSLPPFPSQKKCKWNCTRKHNNAEGIINYLKYTPRKTAQKLFSSLTLASDCFMTAIRKRLNPSRKTSFWFTGASSRSLCKWKCCIWKVVRGEIQPALPCQPVFINPNDGCHLTGNVLFQKNGYCWFLWKWLICIGSH